MTWSDFYFICFAVGFVLSLLSFLAGALHFHLPGLGHQHFHIHFLHGHQVHVPHVHAGAGHGADVGDGGVSPLNFSSLMAFLAWFGGAGYLLTGVWHVWAVMALGLSLVSGLTGGMLVFLFLAKVLMKNDFTMHESDYDPIGLLAKVTSGIRAGGTGEIVYTVEDSSQVCGARSEDGRAIEKGTEVVITGFDKGIASVRRWDEMAEQAGITESKKRTSSE